METLRIATRKSPLALAQTEIVKQSLLQYYPDLNIELVLLSTKGDEVLDKSLDKIGGKGLFVKELELAILNGKADLAVHSMKDMPSEFPDGLEISVILKRADHRDIIVMNGYTSIHDLPKESILGTSSLRRQAQILALRPDLKIKLLRGNVNTRLRKLNDGEYDAIILAAAGLLRLNLDNRISHYFNKEEMLAGVGQGALGIESRQDNTIVNSMIAKLNDPETFHCVSAERAMNHHLGGNCHTPVAAYAYINEKQALTIDGLIASPDGKTILRSRQQGSIEQHQELGLQLAQDLLAQGGDKILASLV